MNLFTIIIVAYVIGSIIILTQLSQAQQEYRTFYLLKIGAFIFGIVCVLQFNILFLIAGYTCIISLILKYKKNQYWEIWIIMIVDIINLFIIQIQLPILFIVSIIFIIMWTSRKHNGLENLA
jgi:hypothetical protein